MIGAGAAEVESSESFLLIGGVAMDQTLCSFCRLHHHHHHHEMTYIELLLCVWEVGYAFHLEAGYINIHEALTSHSLR